MATSAPLIGSRAQLVVSLSGAVVPGSEGLGYFLPEVARALGEALQHGGLTMVPSGASAATVDPPIAISVVLEERAGDRVVLSARARGRRVDIDGPVEGMDAHIDELALRILSLCFERVVAPPSMHPSTRAPRVKDALQAVKDGTTTPPAPAPATTAATLAPATSVTTPIPALTTATPAPATSATTPTPTPGPAALTPPTPSPLTTATTTTAPPLSPAVGSPTRSVVVAIPSAKTAPGELVDPYGPDSRVSDSAPTPIVDRASSGFVRGRVVVHTITDPPGADPGTGSIATQALYAALQRRLRLSVVPMGSGVTSLAVAAEEGQRAQSRAVVMARLDGYALHATADGPIARMRLELSVVREGRLVLRRALLAETQPGAITAAAAEGRRGRQMDPVYLAVSHALEAQLGELALALTAPGTAP